MSASVSSLYDATARQRLAALLDAGSFCEFLPPSERVVSPHLKALGMPVAFDDGLVIGEGALHGHNILCAAQEPAFMGGSVGEVHGAKLTGLLERAARDKPSGVLLVLDTGGVRLHEANAGLIAISEIQRAVFHARQAGVPVIALSAGSNGCYGGIGIVARCCDYVVMTEEGRLSVSGPEVIESQKGVEEFDARDRALVWRTMGGKHRYLIGEANAIVNDETQALRDALMGYLGKPVGLDLEQLLAEHQELARRLDRFGDAQDALEIWQRMGIENPERVPGLEHDAFLAVTKTLGKPAHA